ncbi:MAG: hypothetical protein PUA90_00660 [bacterium]|nr:hypothetical protein [bacterium]
MGRTKLSSEKIEREKKIKKILKISILVLLLFFLILYFVVGIFYNNGNFSVTLDKNLYFDKGMIIYDDVNYKVYRSELYAKTPESFDNISYRWLPDNLHDSMGGTHNGDNYLAYTFYIENQGDLVNNYYYEVVIDDVIKNVDEAVRIRIYKNDGSYVTYAKKSAKGTAESGTVTFVSDEIIAREHVADFNPGDIHKYTVVMWIEGSDPECTDNILGGEFKAHLDFKSEFIDEKEKGSK